MQARNPKGIGGFKKGQSGNPLGKPKENPEIKELARQHSTEAFNKIIQLMKSDDDKIAFAASREVLDRGYGKAPQSMEVTGGNISFSVNISKAIGNKP